MRMSEALEKGGHYNSCNLHHFTHYIHLCLPELVKHWPAQSYIFRSLPQLRETQQKMNWHNVYGNGILDWWGQIHTGLSMVIALS